MSPFPHQGDIVWIDAEPHAGREEGGHNPHVQNVQRPMIVLSGNNYNEYTHMVVGMVLTSTKRNLAPELHREFADVRSGIHGKIILWQIPNYDYEARHGKIVGHVADEILSELVQTAKDIFQ